MSHMSNAFYSKIYHYFVYHDKNKITKYIYTYFAKKNPVIKTWVNHQEMLLPFDHMLPYYQRFYPNYDRQLGRICKVIMNRTGRLRVIDIGANVGDSIINIGEKNGEYLAIEGEKKFFHILKRNVSGYKVFLENLYLTDNEKESSYRSVIEHGTARIMKNNKKCNKKVVTLDHLMASRYKNFQADILKIDTDGFDFKVLRGGADYICNKRPLIYFEWSKEHLNIQGEDELCIFPFVRKMGYDTLLLYDNFGNILTMLQTDAAEQLKLLINYTMQEDKHIYYYDVLLIHKESQFQYKDFIF